MDSRREDDEAQAPSAPAQTITPNSGPMSDPYDNNEEEVVEEEPESPLSDPDAPMVYYKPVDYTTWAHAEKSRLLALGEEAILQSELPHHITLPRPSASFDQDPEAWRTYAEKYTDTINAMIARGVSILNDQCTGEMVAHRWCLGGRWFDTERVEGVTKGEFREFSKWVGRVAVTHGAEDGAFEVPERFRKFEMSEEEIEREERKERGERGKQGAESGGRE